MAEPHQVCVVKLGGSLLDLPDLLARLARALREVAAERRVLLLVGGGAAADHVRALDKHFGFDESTGHWLALESMALNAHILAAAMPEAQLVANADEAQQAWQRRQVAIVDPLHWLSGEEKQGVTIPHRWSFTSDSIAAHLAKQFDGARLVLMKSTLPGQQSKAARHEDADGIPVTRLVEHDVVDEDFPQASAGLSDVLVMNLRSRPHDHRPVLTL